MTAEAYKKPVDPIRLKAMLIECGISQADLAREVAEEMGCPVSRATMNLVINRGYDPINLSGVRHAVEAVIGRNARTMAWLAIRGMAVKDIFLPLGREIRRAMPGTVARRNPRRKSPAMAPGDPQQIQSHTEAEMISQEAMKFFKIFRNPFIDDVLKESDIYMSEEHRYIEAAMLDAARHGGFLAVIGEVGSGKSVMRRKIIEQLKKDGDTLVIYPQMIDKERLNAQAICDAIIQDISSEKCRVKLEDKTRQVQRLLLDRAKAGYRAVLIVEEAHDLKIQTLKYLKRFYELEDGYKKLLGIILIGQTELKHTFNEGNHVDIREVIRRVQVAEIRGLNGNLKEYLAVKFRRVGKDPAEVFADDAYEALGQRLTSTSRDGRAKVSHAYPLLVNNFVARALNLAFEMGEPKISAEVVMAL